MATGDPNPIRRPQHNTASSFGGEPVNDTAIATADPKNGQKDDEIFPILLKPFDIQAERQRQYALTDFSDNRDLAAEFFFAHGENIPVAKDDYTEVTLHDGPPDAEPSKSPTRHQFYVGGHPPRSEVRATIAQVELGNKSNAVPWNQQSLNGGQARNNIISYWTNQSPHEEPFPLLARTFQTESNKRHH